MIVEYHYFDEASAEETQFKGNRFSLIMVTISINLGGGFNYFPIFTPILGEHDPLTSILFFNGWEKNHQLV